jgi:hypothetical protein
MSMTNQKTPHTQSQANVKPEQTDFEPEQALTSPREQGELDHPREGARTVGDRSFRKVQTRSARRKTEPAAARRPGSIATRAPRGNKPGISSRPSDEESARQEKVVRSRPDAQAGLHR